MAMVVAWRGRRTRRVLHRGAIRWWVVDLRMQMMGSGRPLRHPDQNPAIMQSSPLHVAARLLTSATEVVSSLQSTTKTMEKTVLPHGYVGRKSRVPLLVKLLVLSSLASLSFLSYTLFSFPGWHRGSRVPPHAAEIQARCRALNTKPGPPSCFHDRTMSDRFVKGTSHVWIRNATIWTGRVQGLEVIQGDVFLMNGIIKAVGHVDLQFVGLSEHDEIETLDAHGAFVTPGCVCSYRVPLPFTLKYLFHLGLLTFIRIWVLPRPLYLKALWT